MQNGLTGGVACGYQRRKAVFGAQMHVCRCLLQHFTHHSAATGAARFKQIHTHSHTHCRSMSV